MHRSNSTYANWVRTGCVFILIVTATLASAPPGASASRVNLPASDPPPPIFLPILIRDSSPPAPPPSFELIDNDVAAGKIDAETALEYKTFAEFDDARLPEAYRSGSVGGEAGLFMNEVVAAYPALSAAAQAVLAPFFTPPYMAGSWAGLSSHGALLSAPSDWAYISAAGGKARVWYKKADANFQYKAGVVAGALNGEVWAMETDLMAREPILDGAGVQNFVVFDHYRDGWNSTFVPFGGYAGMTVPQKCSPTASVIYINPALADTGSSTRIGIVETTAHEFMHALQFSFTLKGSSQENACTEYSWMGEATATWAEDFVYHDHNTEWRMAQYYLDTPDRQLNNRTNWRDYGEYLLVYYFTRKYGDDDAVRQAWTAAQSVDSLTAFMNFGNFAFEQLAALWNQEPFDTFFIDSEALDKHIKPWTEETLKATGGFQEYEQGVNIKPGAAYAYHYNIDPSVHTITFMDGYTTKISKGPYYGFPEDTVYLQDEVEWEDMRGADTVVMLKYEGMDEPYIWINPARLDICQDWLTQKVSEIVVIDANNEMDRTRNLQTTGEGSKILVTSAPCMKLTGTASVTTQWDNVTEKMTASGLQYEFVATDILTDTLWLANLISPEIEMYLVGGSAAWQISGTTSDGCTYSGSASFAITENNYSPLTLQYQLLPGSRHFLGYEGSAAPDSGSEETYTLTCPDLPPIVSTVSAGNFFMPDGETPVTPGGSLNGTKIVIDGNRTITWEWNLTPLTHP
jgi:hypothetical protein